MPEDTWSALQFAAGEFPRPPAGPTWDSLRGWQGNGGPGRKHPARALPFSLEVPMPELPQGAVPRLVLLRGCFALYADPREEPYGTVGAFLNLGRGGEVVQRVELVQGRHYSDAADLAPVFRANGDGSQVRTLGQAETEDGTYRVDELAIELPFAAACTDLRLTVLGTRASFVVFEVVFGYEPVAACPFRGQGGQVSLGEMGSILRLGNRARFGQALEQFSDAVRGCEDLDEARGLALTFLGVVCAATLELQGPRGTHRLLLDFARELEGLPDADAIVRRSLEVVCGAAQPAMQVSLGTGDGFIDKALRYLERHYARDVSDEEVAREVGLSTSHFRSLFRQVTRQPYQKYLIGLRLEKAREMIMRSDVGIGQISEAVGFVSPAHFTRAFSKRFAVSPSGLRERR